MKDQEIAQEVASEDSAVESKETNNEMSDVGGLIQESKKYRLRAQESESKVKQLEEQIANSESEKLKEQENWRELATKFEEENKSLKQLAEEGQKLQSAIRQDLMDKLSEEDREIAEDLSTDKLQKYVSRAFYNNQVKTNESSPGQMPDTSKNPWKDMDHTERRGAWDKILSKYRS